MPGLFLKILLIICSYFHLNNCYAQSAPALKQNPRIDSAGVWISCFSEKRVLYSKQAVLGLIDFCKKAKINEIYLQLYRANQAYYNSTVVNRTKYEEMVSSAGEDIINFLLKQTERNGIKVFAWINVFSIAENRKADILTRFGDSVLTRDQYLRVSKRDEEINQTDSYYLRDNQLFLEPGDPRVKDYLLSVVNELVTNYPGLDGLHLDYIRYPHPLPYLPDSRFNKYGLSYGYGEKNISQFREKTGLNPLTMQDERESCLLWDNWKRDQVTEMVKMISKQIKSKSRDLLVSCAVIPSPEIAYSVAFQDWPLWLEEGLVDYVVIMNYARDNRLVKERVTSSLSQRGRGKVFIGLGAFLMKKEPDLLLQQSRIVSSLNPDGIVFFSYDDISDKAEIIEKLRFQ